MGVGPTKEKLLELIKKYSKTSTNENNYKLEYEIGPDNEIGGGEAETSNQIYRDIKEVKQFPYVAIGTITFKFSGNESYDHTCFAINKKVIVTLCSFLKHDKKSPIEITTTLTEEKLNIRNCAKYDKENIAVFFLESNFCSQWIGADEYKSNHHYEHINIIFSKGKGTKADIERSESTAFMVERSSISLKGSKLIPILFELNFDKSNISKVLENNEELKNQIIGGVLYYKNQLNGGAYAIGIIDTNLKPCFFYKDTLKYLYDQVYRSKLTNSEGIDENNIIELDLSKKSIGPSHIKILTEFNLNNLKKLNLLKNQIGPQGAFYLGQSKFSNLEILILNFNEIGDEGIQYLSKGPFLGLKYLYLYHNNISNNGVECILDSIFIDTLLLLDLSDNPNINADGIGIIKNRIQDNSNVLKELLCLNLSATTLNEDALDKIIKIKFNKLKKLIMNDIDFSKYPDKINELKAKTYEIRIDGNS